MSELNLAGLRAAAEAATPGGWHVARVLPSQILHETDPSPMVGESRRNVVAETDGPDWARNARHIAAFSPRTALTLIDRLQATESALRDAEAAITETRAILTDVRSFNSDAAVLTASARLAKYRS